MRSIKFVRRAEQEIAADRLHIDGHVRRALHGVHHMPGADRLGHAGDLGDRVDRAHGVGCVHGGDDPGPLGQRFFKRTHIKRAVGWMQCPPTVRPGRGRARSASRD